MKSTLKNNLVILEDVFDRAIGDIFVGRVAGNFVNKFNKRIALGFVLVLVFR